jgi:hypothetical protein
LSRIPREVALSYIDSVPRFPTRVGKVDDANVQDSAALLGSIRWVDLKQLVIGDEFEDFLTPGEVFPIV